MEKSCFFIGHRDAGGEVLEQLREAVERHITQYGVTAFYVGHYGNFDRMAAQAVKEAKKRHPEVTLTRLLPYHPYDRPQPTPAGFDGTFYPPGMESVPKKLAIVRANRYMVDSCTHLIAYAWHFLGSSGDVVEYARRREKRGLLHVDNLARQIRPDAP